MRQALVALIGATFGVSAAAEGFYETALWRPLALVFFALTLALVVATRELPGRLALAAVGGVVAVALWAILSVGWAESVSQAETSAGRWALHAAILTVAVLALRDARPRLPALAALALPVACVAAWVVTRMVAGSGSGLFVGNQLTSPFGYPNADATYFMLGVWPLIAVAESRRLALSAAGVAGATVLGGLIGLTQSRGALVAFVACAIAIVAIVPGRARRVWALVAAGAGVAVLGLGLDVLSPAVAGSGFPRDSTLREAGLAIVGVSLAVGLCWLAVGTASRSFAKRTGERGAGRVSAAALAGLAVGALVVGLASADRIRKRVSSEYHDFVHLASRSDNSATLLGGGPNQYDYWRVALNEFRDAPLKGVGAGNYQSDYFRERRTNEDVRQPHSLVFQNLAELGIVGTLGLAIFVLAVLAGLARAARRGRTVVGERRVAVAAGGMFLAWLSHAALDWTWLFAGLTGMGLLAGALLVVGPPPDAVTAGEPATDGPRPDPSPAAPGRLSGLRTRLARVGVGRAAAIGLTAAAVTFAALAATRQMTQQHLRAQARTALARDPVRTIDRTSRALALGDEDVTARYLRAAAFARLDEFAPARRELERALELEPHWWVTSALIGDLEVRHGDLSAAKRAYKRALALNPRDLGLAQAAADPRALARSLAAGDVQAP